MELVKIENGRVVTDSLTVAQTFCKSHDNVLRDIRSLECSRDFSLLNFEESSYTSDRGRSYPKYFITQDGFAFLVMGYTGKESARFKEMYIAEFARMRAQLNSPINIEDLIASPDMLIHLATAIKAERTAKKLLQAAIEDQKPYVEFAQTWFQSEQSVKISDFAHSLATKGMKIGTQRLYKKLREWGLIAQRSTEPTQRGIEMKLFEVKQGIKHKPSGEPFTWRTPYLTVKGQGYIIERLQKEGVIQ